MKNYPLFRVHVNVDEAIKNLKATLASGYINEGVEVTQLRNALKPRLGENIILTNCCTSALHLALKLVGAKEGKTVVSTPMTCVASNTPIVDSGAHIEWSDIDPMTGMPSAQDVTSALKSNTCAVLYTAWAGNLGDVLEVQNVCKKAGVPLILDAAHAFGARIVMDNVPVLISDLIDYTCFSFQAIKHFTTGDGGAIVINPNIKDREQLVHRASCLKWFGLDRDASKTEAGEWKGQQWDVDVVEAGYKFNMNNVAASIGLSQLESIDAILGAHTGNALEYDYAFKGSTVIPLRRSVHELTAPWVYTVRTPWLRDEKKYAVIEALNKEGIMAGIVHVPNDRYTCFKDSKQYLPGVREFEATQFSLPCGWWLSPNDIEHIAKRVLEIVKKS
jgi:dTDP-4-amino-4,6-dideoxygalactose transaminase